MSIETPEPELKPAMTDLPPAGPEMDALVAEATGLPDFMFSGRIGSAMYGLEEWFAQHPGWSVNVQFNNYCHPKHWEVVLFDWSDAEEFVPYESIGDSLAYAISAAIVQAYQGTKEDKHE